MEYRVGSRVGRKVALRLSAVSYESHTFWSIPACIDPMNIFVAQGA